MAHDQLKAQTATVAEPLQSSIFTTNNVPTYDDLQRFDLLVLSQVSRWSTVLRAKQWSLASLSHPS